MKSIMENNNTSVCSGHILDDDPYFDKDHMNNPAFLKCVSFNLHGFNQGKIFLESLLCQSDVDFVFVQETWLTNSQLYKLATINPNYVCFATSGMEDQLSSDILFGRPHGGIATFIKKKYTA